jgi:hypothetical protein
MSTPTVGSLTGVCLVVFALLIKAISSYQCECLGLFVMYQL